MALTRIEEWDTSYRVTEVSPYLRKGCGNPECPMCYPYSHEGLRYLERENYYLKKELSYYRYNSQSLNIATPSLPEPKKKPMSKLTTLAKKMLDSDLRAFVKLGVLDDSLEITDKGVDFLLAQYLSENKVRLAKEARKTLKEEKEKED